MECSLRASDQPLALARETANQLYRATQEAVTNAHRHGHARRIEIHLALDTPGLLTLTIDDDGRGLADGFSQDSVVNGFGLKIMRHRLGSLGGRFLMGNSPVTSGARITFIAPVHRTDLQTSSPL
jgi:signal transduction histidine kinase